MNMYLIGGMIMIIMLYTVAIYGLLCKIEKSIDKLIKIWEDKK